MQIQRTADVLSVAQSAQSCGSISDERRLAQAHGALMLTALLVSAMAGLLIRLEWLTPALDMMQARTFGALLTLHGALAFYYVLIPAGFFLPGLFGLAALHGQAVPPLPRLGKVAWGLQAIGLGVLLVGAMTGGSEAGWSAGQMNSGRFDLAGVGPVALSGLLAGSAVVAQAIRVWVAAHAAPRASAPRRMGGAALLAAASVGLVAGAMLVLCMVLVGLPVWAGVSLFDPGAGGQPLLYDRIFGAFQQTALTLCWLTPMAAMVARMAEGASAARSPRAFGPALMLAVLSALPAWGSLKVWSAGLAIGAMFGLGLCGMRLARAQPALHTSHLLYALFWIAVMQALTAQLVLVMPNGASLYAQTTLATAVLHLAAVAVVGLALPGLLADRLDPERLSPSLLLAGGVIAFAGMQLMLLPDAMTGLMGLSYRANAYPSEWSTLKVLGTAGSTILLSGLLLSAAAFLRAIRSPSTNDSSARD